MRNNKWMPGILSILFCAVVIAVNPMQTQAGQNDRSAYRNVFDASYYYNTYSDVAAAYGMDEEALFNHFVTFGVKEGRSGSAEFNPQAYRQRYADLQSAFGNNMAAYCRHYVSYGKAEGRNASADGQLTVTAAADTVASVEANLVPVTQSPQENEQSTIGTCTTSYVDNIPRANNVELAAARINGVVVQPGSSFSFSRTIGARTSANGYVEAPIFISGKTGTGIGGGVCQVSSTLYAAMVYAGLPATERHAHSLPVDYLPAGLDATIAGNYLDLKFTNIYQQPLLIQAYAEGGQVTVSLVLQ